VLLGEPGNRDSPQVQLLEHLNDGAQLPLTAVDEQQVGAPVEAVLAFYLPFERAVLRAIDAASPSPGALVSGRR